MKMWRAAYAAYKDFQELEKWAPKRFKKRIKYVETVWKELTDWF